jgi:two-component system, cell cycle sensor histidine kinase and response regulator CckA
VQRHNGHITCNSEPGKGTTFKVYLPAISAEMKREASLEASEHARGTETVLLVDDEEDIRELGKKILEGSGYTVLTAANGKDAVNLFKTHMGSLSLVILDVIMPDMGGKQCLEELLRIDPEVNVLIASGFVATEQTRKTIETKAKGFVRKPFNMEQMLKAVREVLDKT